MTIQSGKLKAESRHKRRSPLALRASSAARDSQLATRNFPRALTLIELLVSIAILVTVLGAVIPVISPNNDARRIRQGARQVQSMLAQAQALAAREGRPYGVAFRESGVDADGDSSTGINGLEAGDGTALEVYFISEPKAYTGFSEFSSVRLTPVGGNGPNDLVRMQFVLAGPPTGSAYPLDLVDDMFPPNVIRRGDRIEVAGVVYRLIDLDKEGDDGDLEEYEFPEGSFYSLRNLDSSAPQFWLCRPETPRPPLAIYAGGATTPKPYRILRQASSPATRPGNTSAPPLQLPRGVGIDLAASGLDVIFPDPNQALSPQFGCTSMQSPLQTLLNSPDFMPFVRPLSVGVMFAPSGRLEGIWVNGEKLQGSPERLYMLVGRSENSVRPGADKLADSDFDGVPGGPNNSPDADGDATLLERRSRVNWLNGDSLWVTVAANTGRIVTSDVNVTTDPRDYLDKSDPTPIRQAAWQIRDSREFAREMTNPARQ